MKIIIYILLFFSYSSYGQYNWPLENNQIGNITGTIGEPRKSNGIKGARLHKGTDITGSNYKVYAINSGNIIVGYTGIPSNSFLKINGIYYYHVRKKATISEGNYINAGDPIGDMMSGGTWPIHVHLQNNQLNFLNNQLTNYTDNVIPIIYNVEFFKNGLKKIFLQKKETHSLMVIFYYMMI